MVGRSRPLELLLVEDNAGDVRLIHEALRESAPDHHLHVVHDGEAALTFLRRDVVQGGATYPDLVVLDLNLPRLDGRAVLRAIRADDALARLPVVVLSGSSAPQDVASAYELGANAYVTKPLDLGDFIDSISQIVAFWATIAALPGC